ncbi:integral membrane protein 25d9-6 [Grosmannia clavigera kw1407]|uniref:Integral membrane protein 25d9-6 n=1 Tax=Grosmannia clavigera (strain kw1407 / UAMH 11150) TaxID=655863 RepID=F0XIX3_GROCL|nr:integral membrane protein 25d9-6 [Grosmannia clavigera kw1407]EFX02027.1 integral membrane protein 25d9-6 [Grosmannia clavigera kw1407]
MSFKIERDTFQQVQGQGSAGPLVVRPPTLHAPHLPPLQSSSALQPTALQALQPQPLPQLPEHPITSSLTGGPPLPGTSGKHPLTEAVGTALTGGVQNAGTKGYLAAYIKQLEENPLRTKMLTAGTLAGAQELLASWLARDRNKHGNYFTSRVPKMAAYGALVSAPLGHFLIWFLQKVFHRRTSLRAKILQILVSNFIVAPIQNTVYLTAMAWIAGARTYHQVRATVRVGFWKVMRVSWITSPICLAFAQKFLPEYAWVPFFNLVSFIIGTYINTITKKRRLAALRKKHFGDGRGEGRGGTLAGRSEDYPPPPPMGGPNPSY